jgi:HlyD family secretion protein
MDARTVLPQQSRGASPVARRRLLAPVLAAAGLAILLGGGAYWYFNRGGETAYVTQAVGRGTVMRAVTATGSVNPVLTITVGTYVSGVIQQIHCDFNTVVKKGQLCAKIDPRPYQMVVEQDGAALASAKAQLVKDQANLAYAQANARRYGDLIAQQATSQDLYDSAVNALNQARAQVAADQASIAQRQAQLDAAEVNLGYTDIVSPVDGVVVSRNVTMGQTVAASFQTPTMFLIATDLSKMQVDTSVSESDIGEVRVGNKARFTVEAFPNRTFGGIVTQVRQAPQTVQNVVTYDVVVTADNAQLLLKPGMTATVRIITAERDGVLRVPDQAFRFVPGGLAGNPAQEADRGRVWLLRDGKPAAMAVVAGVDDDSYSEIVSGEIAAGDRVIVSERAGQSDAAPAPNRGGGLRVPGMP